MPIWDFPLALVQKGMKWPQFYSKNCRPQTMAVTFKQHVVALSSGCDNPLTLGTINWHKPKVLLNCLQYLFTQTTGFHQLKN